VLKGDFGEGATLLCIRDVPTQRREEGINETLSIARLIELGRLVVSEVVIEPGTQLRDSRLTSLTLLSAHVGTLSAASDGEGRASVTAPER
jgi:hypothetical protein